MTHLAPSSRLDQVGRALRPVLALDMGGTRLRTALVLPTGEIVARRTARTPRSDARALVDACLSLLADTRAAAAGERPDHLPVALAISAPGPLDPADGMLVDPPNLHHSLWGFPLAGTLGAALGLPAALERDTQVAALAEGSFGAGRGLADYVYLTVSTGIGGAVVSDGRLLRGPDGVAGELGHMVVDADGPICGCGARGHLEGIASGTGIAAAARQAIQSGQDGAVAPDSPLGRLAAARARGMEGPIEAVDVARAEEQGDPVAAQIMQRARDAFAAAVVSIVDIFNPSRVIVGGGVATGQGDRLLGPARELVHRHAFRIQARRVEIMPAELGDDVGLAGGVLLVGLANIDSGARGSGQMGLHTDISGRDDLTDDVTDDLPAEDDRPFEVQQRRTAAAG